MFACAQRQFLPTTSLPQDDALDLEVPEFRLPQHYVHSSSLPLQVLTMEDSNFLQLYAREHSVPDHIPLSLHANQVYTGLSTATHVNQQAQHNLTFQRPTDSPMVPEPFSSFFPSSLVRTHGNGVMSASPTTWANDPGPYSAYWGSHMTFEHSWTLLPPLLHPIDQGPHNLGDHLLDQPGTYPSFSHAPYFQYPSSSNDQNIIGLFNAHNPPSCQSLFPPTTSTVPVELAPSFRFVTLRNTGLSRRRRGALAIEYGGLWIDEEELLKGLAEPDGRINVHRCLWEEDRSSCELWIKSDKSCINTHIQKWHGGKPGGEKLEVQCRWSACGKKMLKESIARHILSVHLGEMWKCHGCGNKIARKDAYERHSAKSDFEGCRITGALVTYSADVRVIDARTALDGRGRVRYVDA